jgi:type I restriction enzyme, S subunit
MNPLQLLAHFERISDPRDAIPRLRRFILDIAVRGRLVLQNPKDEPAFEIIKRIQREKAGLGLEPGQPNRQKRIGRLARTQRTNWGIGVIRPLERLF